MGTKKLFNSVSLAAGQSPPTDIKAALDNIANCPSVPPFINRQLIQRFVTSNPSPAFNERVAAAFDNNASGTRGDLAANFLRSRDGKSKNGINGINYFCRSKINGD